MAVLGNVVFDLCSLPRSVALEGKSVRGSEVKEISEFEFRFADFVFGRGPNLKSSKKASSVEWTSRQHKIRIPKSEMAC